MRAVRRERHSSWRKQREPPAELILLRGVQLEDADSPRCVGQDDAAVSLAEIEPGNEEAGGRAVDDSAFLGVEYDETPGVRHDDLAVKAVLRHDHNTADRMTLCNAAVGSDFPESAVGSLANVNAIAFWTARGVPKVHIISGNRNGDGFLLQYWGGR